MNRRWVLASLLAYQVWARERVGLNTGWSFHYGDVNGGTCPGEASGQQRTTLGRRACAACSVPRPADPCFDDSLWRSVSLPHDFVIEGPAAAGAPAGQASPPAALQSPFDPQANVDHGFLRPGTAWYRRTFTLPEGWAGGTVWIEFDGVYRNSDVYLNGQRLGHHESGFTSFYFYVDGVATFGDTLDNVLAVYCDATQPEGWWYDGGGIYRHVWLNYASKTHIPQWGIYAPALVTGSIDALGLVTDRASVLASVELRTAAAQVQEVQLRCAVYDEAENVVKEMTTLVKVAPRGTTAVRQTLELGRPGHLSLRLWSPSSPSLLSLKCTVLEQGSGRTLDAVTVRFGIRKVVFDKDRGLLLNGLPFKIQGMCNHQDFGGTGVAMPMGLQRFRIRRQMQAGVNAWRMSHNPPNPELLDYLDEAGVVVWAETRNFFGQEQWFEDFADMLRRDRNHPSILFWSLCNEGWRPEGCLPAPPADGERIGLRYRGIIQQLDPHGQRAMTAAMDQDWGLGVGKVLDVQGVNYRYEQYDAFHIWRPDVPMIGSETASCTTDRGVFSGMLKGYASAYATLRGRGCAQPGACIDTCLQDSMRPVMEKAWIMGGFVWTGFDYRGEPTPDAWPTVNAHYGALFDMAGFPKDSFYYYQAWWTSSPVVHVLPHWNWEPPHSFPSSPGLGVKVWVYTNAATVRLFLNGVQVGASAVPKYGHASFQVAYKPGKLTAIGLDAAGRTVGSDTVLTSGPPARLVAELLWGAEGISSATSSNTALVAVRVVDAHGVLAPTASNVVTFSASAGAAVVGVANGNPSSHEPDRNSVRSAFAGRVAAVVQLDAQPGSVRKVLVTATSPGLLPAAVSIPVLPPPAGERELGVSATHGSRGLPSSRALRSYSV